MNTDCLVSLPRHRIHHGHLPVHAAEVAGGKQPSANALFTVPGNRPFAMEKFLIVPIGTEHTLHNMNDLIKTSC